MATTICSENYKAHLEVCFKYIFNNSDISEKCYPISECAKSIYNKLRSYRDYANWSISIDPPWTIPIENDRDFQTRSAYFLIGGKVQVKDSVFTFYSLSVCIVIDNEIVRRFHFDIGTGISKILKPKCHMQYGGKASMELNYAPHLSYSLREWIRKPRFPFPPLDIVLVLDLTLRQFGTSIGGKFVQESFWKHLVKRSESFVQKNYYGQIHRYFDNIDRNERTLFEELCS